MTRFLRACLPIPVLTLLLQPLTLLASPVTAEFQQNDSYQGTVMMRLRSQDTIIATPTTASMDVDGGDAAVGDALYSLIFLRFDDVFGTAPGQIPYGSAIVSATLEVVTNVSSNAQSGNIFTVAPLVNPLLLPETGTIYNAYSNNAGFGGPDFADGHTLRPGNPFRSVNLPVLTHDQGERVMNDITEVVRRWANGTVETPFNHGLIISDTNGTDGWAIASIGHATPANRPKLRVEYYPPATAVERKANTVVFAQGTEPIPGSGTFYEDCVSVWLPDTVTPVNNANFATLSQRQPENGSSITAARYLDGANPPTLDSADDQMILQFQNIFGNQPGQIRILPNLRIERASLRLTTGATGDNRSPGPVDVQRMLAPWYTTDEFGSRTFKRYSEFVTPGAPAGTIGIGPTVASGDAAAVEFSYWGMQLNQVVDADVTATVKAWAAGQPNFGWSIQQSTSDGWAIFFPGAGNTALRPQLLITYSYDPDADSDGLPDEWESTNGTAVNTADADGDADTDGLTNLQEFLLGTRGNLADTDGDGYNDKAESGTGLWVSATDTGTNPLKADSDGDGLRDGLENPALSWTGGTQPGSDPNKPDSDGDGFPDYTEVSFETNPASQASVPTAPYNNVIVENFDSNSVDSSANFVTSTGTYIAGIFDSMTPSNVNVAQLTDGIAASSNSALAWDYVPVQGRSVRVTFDYRMTADAGTAEAADGMGIGLFRISNPAYGSTGGINPGLAPRQWEDPRSGNGYPDAVFFGFDIFGGAVEGNTLRVTGPQNPLALLANVVPALQLNNGLFNRVILTANTAGTSGTIFHVDLITDVNGTATSTRLVSNLPVPGFDLMSEEFRVVVGSRNGTTKVKTEVDNLQVAVAGRVAPPIPAFKITEVTPTAAGLSFSWESVQGGSYTIEASETMTGTWSTLGSAITATDITSSTVVPLPATPAARFFRVRRTQ